VPPDRDEASDLFARHIARKKRVNTAVVLREISQIEKDLREVLRGKGMGSTVSGEPQQVGGSIVVRSRAIKDDMTERLSHRGRVIRIKSSIWLVSRMAHVKTLPPTLLCLGLRLPFVGQRGVPLILRRSAPLVHQPHGGESDKISWSSNQLCRPTEATRLPSDVS